MGLVLTLIYGIIAAGSYIGGIGSAIGTTLGPFWSAVISSAIASGISYTISALTQPTPPGPISQGIDRVRNIQRDPQAPGRVYYGHGFGSGYLVFADTTDHLGLKLKGARYLHICLVVAVGPISGITKIYLNDEEDLKPFRDLVSFITSFIGSRDQQMFRGPVQIRQVNVELPQDWLAKERPLSGIAYLWGTMAAHPDVFPGGPPSIRMELDGAILYDPRDPNQNYDDQYSWAWSNNWAVCVYNYLINPEYGRGARRDQICPDCFLESAQVSDEPMKAPSQTYKDADGNDVIPTIPRYTLDGSFETNEQPVDIMSTMAAAAAGTITFYDGQWHIRAGQMRETLRDLVPPFKPVVLTADNLREDEALAINVRPGRKEAANIVRGSYISPSAKDRFTAQDFPEQTHPDFVREDGGVELVSNLEFPFTLDVDRAQTLARISLLMGRLGMRVTFPGGPELLQIPPWEVIELAFPEYGWGKIDDNTGEMVPSDPAGHYKKFYVADRYFNESGGINLILAEYDDDMYADHIDPALLPPRSDLPDPFTVFPPENAKVKEAVHKNPDGTRVAKLVVTWEPPSDGFADFYIIKWRNTAGIEPFTARVVPGDVLMTEIIGLEIGRYEIQLQTRVINKLSEPVILYGEVTYTTAPPPNPMNFRVSLMADGTRRFTWDIVGKAPPDLRGYEIRYVKDSVVPVPDWEAVEVFLSDIPGQSVETKKPTAEGSYLFLIKSFDWIGSYSERFAITQIFISPRESTDLANREYSEEHWPGEKVDCRINSLNQLAAFGSASWNRVPTWAAMDTWAAGPMRIFYTAPPITLDTSDFATFEFKVEGVGIGGYYVMVRSRVNTGDDFSDFSFVTGATGKEFQFRLIAWNNGVNAVAINKFYVTLRARDETDQLQNVDAPQSRPVITRTENSAVLTSTGEVTHINATPTGIDLDDYTWARMTGTGHMHFPVLNDQLGDQGTIEITCHVHAYPQNGRIVGQGNDWSIDYTYELFDGIPQGVIRLNAVGYTGGTFTPLAVAIGKESLGVFELTLTINAGVVKFYVNRDLIGTTGGTGFSFAQSSNPVAVGARYLSGVISNYGAIDAKEFRVWRIPLNMDQVRAYSGVSVNPGTPGLAGYWRLDDDFTTTFGVRDRTNDQTGQAHPNVSPVRVGARMSPPIDLAIIPQWAVLAGSWVGTTPSGTSIAVYMGIGTGNAPPQEWTPVNQALTTIPSPMILNGTPGNGFKAWCLQVLIATDITKTPTLNEVSTILVYFPAPGELVIQPPHPFSVIRQVSLTARSDLGVSPIGWNLIAHDPTAARFRIFDAVTGAARSAQVDVLFQGSRIWA